MKKNDFISDLENGVVLHKQTIGLNDRNSGILRKLNYVFEGLGVSWVLTGTAAIALLGIPTGVHDIDVKVFELSDTARKALEGMQTVAGALPDYPGEQKCYSFKVDGVIVNVLLSESPEPYINVKWEMDDGIRIGFKVQPLIYAIRDKMKLNRSKDHHFMFNLIQTLTSLC